MLNLEIKKWWLQIKNEIRVVLLKSWNETRWLKNNNYNEEKSNGWKKIILQICFVIKAQLLKLI